MQLAVEQWWVQMVGWEVGVVVGESEGLAAPGFEGVGAVAS